ncbi:hypothetical protein Tco_0839270 [Tanacetum coccineum]|uniref:Uncharacterized protein n=1 Tax=Tanacetum coccineum TaxID=301880 RepID=A0ABQ5AR16_9ASTR
MVEPARPLKKKDQVVLDEEMARNLEAQMQAELIKEKRLARQKEEEAKEQGEITIEERSRLFVELMNRRKKHFAKLRAKEIRRKPPTKSQKRNQLSTYLKNMAGYKHKVVKDENVEAEKDDDPEEEEMKKHMEIVQDEEEITIDAIPVATKPPMIVEYKVVKEGQKGFYHLIRANGSSKRYSLMIRMLQGIDIEDLETL